MSRFLNTLFCLVLVSVFGCQSGDRSAPWANLHTRLTALEHERLAADVDLDLKTLRASNAVGGIRRSTAPAIDDRDSSNWGNALSLVDFGQDGELEFDDGSEAPDIELGRDEQYLRRPPLDSFWDTVERDIKNMPADLWRDTKLVYVNPVNLVILGTAYGGSLALQQTGVDKSVEDHFERAHRHFNKEWRDGFAAAGNPGTHFALAGAWYLLGQQTLDEKTYDVGKTMFSALMINGLTVLIGQSATYDRGPNGERGTFPSGHTSSSFVMASVLHRAYGHAVGAPLYGLAALVAAERIDSGEHYMSDVVMGGVLGLVIGHTVAAGREPEFYGWKLVPYVSPHSGSTGVALSKTFK